MCSEQSIAYKICNNIDEFYEIKAQLISYWNMVIGI